MFTQVQCPNCGGYKITTQEGKREEPVPLTPKKSETFLKSEKVKFTLETIAMIIFVWIPIVAFLLLIVGSLLMGSTDEASGLCVLVPFVGGALIFTFGYINDRERYLKIYREYTEKGFITLPENKKVTRYYCNLCGYRWEWRQGEPWPEVKVRPDLIAKGEKRLEEEAAAAEEERKRKERDFIMLSQRYGKK